METGRVEFYGSTPRVWDAKGTIMVASAPKKAAPKLSDPPVHDPLRVNDRVAFGTPEIAFKPPPYVRVSYTALQPVFGVLGGSA